VKSSARPQSGTGSLRIIGGRWRRRTLHFPDRPGLRPTPDRVRETVFNWLQADVPGSVCLDLFAGSGALGLEAASRGAQQVLMLEQDKAAAQALLHNIAALSAVQAKVEQRDTMAFLQAGRVADTPVFDLVFIDPPYQSGLLTSCCDLLEQGGWLADNAKIYLECEAASEPTVPAGWQPLKQKRAGQVGYYLFNRTQE
jgi:16S rRNA (guanine966-N2)-methyltransferase